MLKSHLLDDLAFVFLIFLIFLGGRPLRTIMQTD